MEEDGIKKNNLDLLKLYLNMEMIGNKYKDMYIQEI